MAAGWNFTLALMEDGSVMAWGKNGSGELGDGTRVARVEPSRVHDLDGVVAVAAGMSHCLALRHDGSVLAWGSNDKAQLGDGTQTDRWTPVLVALPAPAIAIAAGSDHSVALLSDGQLLGWGDNLAGQLGGGPDDTRPRTAPGPMWDLGGTCCAIAAGCSITAVLMDDGSVRCWGGKAYDADGRSSTMVSPVTIPGLPSRTVAVDAGLAGLITLQADGSVWTWQQPTSAPISIPPVDPVVGLERDVVAVAGGVSSAMALRTDGTVFTWNRNPWRPGVVSTAANPAAPLDLASPARSISAGWDHGAAAMFDGSVRAWGGEQPLDDVDVNGVDPALALGTTKLGGRPDLAEGSSWPNLRGAPQAFMAQLDLAELAHCDHHAVLPPSGLLSFFYDLELSVGGFDPADRDGWLVTFTPAGTPLVRLDFPSDLPSYSRIPASRLRPQADLTLAPAAAKPVRRELAEDEWPVYDEFTSDLDQELRPFHRVLGHPQPVQGDMQRQCQLVSNGIHLGGTISAPADLVEQLADGADEWLLLLQVDSDDDVGFDFGLGRLYYWIRSEDLAARRFENVWFVFQCT